jgi:hypothetical protein
VIFTFAAADCDDGLKEEDDDEADYCAYTT